MICHTEKDLLDEENDWSKEFQDFIDCCLHFDSKDRLSLKELNNHSFLKFISTEEDFIDYHFMNQSKKIIFNQILKKEMILDLRFYFK